MSAEAITKQIERILTGITLDAEQANRLHDAVLLVTSPHRDVEPIRISEEKPFNQLTPAQAERLDWLQEECAEVIKAVCKIKRHGYKAYAPTQPNLRTNKQDLEIELGHVGAVVAIMKDLGDISNSEVISAQVIKNEAFNLGRCYMHHQGQSLTEIVDATIAKHDKGIW